MNTIIQSAIFQFMGKKMARNDLVIGVVTSGRTTNLVEHNKMIGFCMSILPLRIKINEHWSPAQYFEQIQTRMQELSLHSSVNLEAVSSTNGHRGDLYDIVYVYENYPKNVDFGQKKDGFVQQILSIFDQYEFPLIIYCTPSETLEISFCYRPLLVGQELISEIKTQLPELLKGFTLSF